MIINELYETFNGERHYDFDARSHTHTHDKQTNKYTCPIILLFCG